jgi:hypothetical protein
VADAAGVGELREAVTASPLGNMIVLADGRVRLAWAGAAGGAGVSGGAGVAAAAVEREVAEISRLAAAQTASILEAAEREAAQLRAAITELSAGPDGGAVHVLTATKPQVRPGTKTRGRQVRAARKVQIAFVVLTLVGLAGGSAEIAAHGFSFFLFRNTGAGAGNPQNLNENQGPGQPDAPGVHHKASPGHGGG